MIFEMFYDWLYKKINRQKLCEHDFGYILTSHTCVGSGEGYEYKLYQCKKCSKKEKRYTGSVSHYYYY